jgi:hypothetical protein
MSKHDRDVILIGIRAAAAATKQARFDLFAVHAFQLCARPRQHDARNRG